MQTVWERFRKEGVLNTDVVARAEAEELQQRVDSLQREVCAARHRLSRAQASAPSPRLRNLALCRIHERAPLLWTRE